MSNEKLTVPVTLYRVGDSLVSLTELKSIGAKARSIWEQADIALAIKTEQCPFTRWLDTNLPANQALNKLAYELTRLYQQSPPPPSNVVGFCGNWTGNNARENPNGFSFHFDWDMPTLLFFVRDHQEHFPYSNGQLKGSPPLERIIAHEIGHIFRLPHYNEPTTNLMASGVNGIALDPLEIELSRAGAKWILDRAS